MSSIVLRDDHIHDHSIQLNQVIITNTLLDIKCSRDGITTQIIRN